MQAIPPLRRGRVDDNGVVGIREAWHRMSSKYRRRAEDRHRREAKRRAGAGHVDWLRRDYERRRIPSTLIALTDVMYFSPDESLAHRARRALEQLCLDAETLDAVWRNLESRTPVFSHTGTLTAATVQFLLGPVSDPGRCTSVPEVRIVEYLDSPRDTRRNYAGFYPYANKLHDFLVAYASGGARAPAAAQTVIDLLNHTDQPDLLLALERRLEVLMCFAVSHDRSLFYNGPAIDASEALRRLWTEEAEPTPFTRIFFTNSNFQHVDRSVGWIELGFAVFVPVVTGRIDQITYSERAFAVTDALIDIARSRAPREITDRCRTALKTLPPGVHQDELFSIATKDPSSTRRQYARDLIRDSAYPWTDPRKGAVGEALPIKPTEPEWEPSPPAYPRSARRRGVSPSGAGYTSGYGGSGFGGDGGSGGDGGGGGGGDGGGGGGGDGGGGGGGGGGDGGGGGGGGDGGGGCGGGGGC